MDRHEHRRPSTSPTSLAGRVVTAQRQNAAGPGCESQQHASGGIVQGFVFAADDQENVTDMSAFCDWHSTTVAERTNMRIGRSGS